MGLKVRNGLAYRQVGKEFLTDNWNMDARLRGVVFRASSRQSILLETRPCKQPPCSAVALLPYQQFLVNIKSSSDVLLHNKHSKRLGSVQPTALLNYARGLAEEFASQKSF